MIGRLFKNWKTSVLAIVLLVGALILLKMGKIVDTEFYALLPTIVGLLYVKDSIVDTKNYTAAQLKERLFNNIKSTVLGFASAFGGLALVYYDMVSWMQFSLFLPTCLGLILVKDSIFKFNPETLAVDNSANINNDTTPGQKAPL